MQSAYYVPALIADALLICFHKGTATTSLNLSLKGNGKANLVSSLVYLQSALGMA